MSELLELSARIIDTGDVTIQPNRITQELSEVGPGLAVVESFSHVWALDTGTGLVLVDTGHEAFGEACMESLRRWSRDPVDLMIYTHGHVDHVGGSIAVMAEAEANGRERPGVVAHCAVEDRFSRYRETAGWNLRINARQMGGAMQSDEIFGPAGDSFLGADVAAPTETHRDGMTKVVGDTTLELHHANGETDDHTWIWDPRRAAIFVGDLFIWNFPNAGNPQKVQRFAGDWAAALRAMSDKGPELLLPAHGLPIAGRERIAGVLDTTASALEYLVEETVTLMNQGATLDQILHAVRLPGRFDEVPYLVPNYDEPEFVIRNIYRLYGGWWDGDPANLHPAPKSKLGSEVASLAGGSEALATRALSLVEAGELAVAAHLIELAVAADPSNGAVHEIRVEVYAARRRAATSLMAKGIYKSVMTESKSAVESG